MDSDNNHFEFVPLMPDGEPCPSVLLEKDLIRFLRLEELGVKNPANTLRYYRERERAPGNKNRKSELLYGPGGSGLPGRNDEKKLRERQKRLDRYADFCIYLVVAC